MNIYGRRCKSPMPLWNGQEPLGGKAKQIAASLDQLGRLTIFYVGLNSHVYQNLQTQPSGIIWVGEQKFSKDKAKMVMLIQDSAKALNLFYIGSDNVLRQNVQTDPAHNIWSGDVVWSESAKTASVVLDATGALNILFVDTHGGLFRKRQADPLTNQWSAPVAFGDAGVKTLCSALDINNNVKLIYVDKQSNLVRRTQTDAVKDIWSGPVLFDSPKVHEVCCSRDLTGAMHVFYVGTSDQLFHDFQTNTNVDIWQGQTPFVGFKGHEIVAGRSDIFGLECFFVGENNGLWRNFEDSEPSQPNNANWHGFARMDADFQKLASAKRITSVNNSDGRLEIFFVGTNDHVYHDWENTIPTDFESNINQVVADNCSILKEISVTIAVHEDIVVDFESGPSGGFSFQLNAYSLKGHRVVYQQYVIDFIGKTLGAAIENWRNLKQHVVNNRFKLCEISQSHLPAGYQLAIVLLNDDAGNITGATFAVVDNTGNEIAKVTKHLGLPSKDLAPIVAFEMNLVGPENGQQVILSSGSGNFFYAAEGNLIPGARLPPSMCTDTAQVTAERSNVLYSAMVTAVGGPLVQRFSITPREPL